MPLVALLLFVGVFHVVTMPRFFYPGDNAWPRREAGNLLMTGQLGLPYSFKSENPKGYGDRGQYLFENDAKQRLFSKYGFGYTLLYLPPMLIERIISGQLTVFHGTTSLLVVLNLYDVLLSLLIAFYVYQLAALYWSSSWGRVAFTLVTFYTTFLWHYLRAPGLDIFQIAAFTGFSYHTASFLRRRDAAAAGESGPWKALTASVAYAGVLVLMKASYVPLFLLAGWFSVSVGPDSRPLRDRLRQNLSTRKLRLLWSFAPGLVAPAVLLWSNAYRFGSPLNSGYGQWQPSGMPVVQWGLGIAPKAALHFFLKPGNANLFIHAPILFIALFGWLRFVRQYRTEAHFLLGTIAAVAGPVSFLSIWSGEWGYGPRYLVTLVIIGALPFVEVWQWIVRRRAFVARWLLRGTIGVVLLISLRWQVGINSLHYFAHYYLMGFFSQFKQPEITQYFEQRFCRAQTHWELWNYDRHQKPFFPMKAIEGLDVSERETLFKLVRERLHDMAQPNYYFLRW